MPVKGKPLPTGQSDSTSVQAIYNKPVKMLIIVIRVNPVDGIVKNLAAINVSGNTANPNKSSTMNARPSSAALDQPSSWKAPNVMIINIVVITYVK